MQRLKHYIVFWIALVSLFNVVCFITPEEWYGTSKYSGTFWTGYAFIMGAFVLHLIYAVFAFRENNAKKRALNNPITIISFFELGIMIAVGTVCLMVPSLPNWIGIIVCYTVLALSVVFLVSAKAVEENKLAANERLNNNTAFMRELTDYASSMVRGSKADSIHRATESIYEAIRYSDPISSGETREYEEEISNALKDLNSMLQSNPDEDSFCQRADVILLLIEKRNNKIKALKRRV